MPAMFSNSTIICLLALGAAVFSISAPSALADTPPEAIHYQLGSQVSEQVLVEDKDRNSRALRELITEQGKKLNIVMIFGGGGMGYEKTDKIGGLWCPDSFEDMHILRSLVARYKDQIGFFPIAVPPVFHSRRMGFAENVFLQADTQSNAYQEAVAAFIDSTEDAFKAGTIPLQPWYDTDFNLLVSRDLVQQRPESKQQIWHGAFRSATETQHYGVPNMWLLDAEGRVVAEPFRGNVYHPHGDEITINYSLKDVIEAIRQAF